MASCSSLESVPSFPCEPVQKLAALINPSKYCIVCAQLVSLSCDASRSRNLKKHKNADGLLGTYPRSPEALGHLNAGWRSCRGML